MSKNKIRIGIDIDEILRAKWYQFDRFYVDEFGEEGLPNKENQYVFDFFGEYLWKDTVEKFKELKEPEDTPEHINPLDYVVDEKTGEAIADSALFKKEEKIKLTKKEVYNRFMYEDFLFEIHGSAPMIYRGVDLDLSKFTDKYNNSAEIILFSKENVLSIPPTLFFISKLMPRSKKFIFIENEKDIWKDIDILITTNPEYFKKKQPKKKRVIKIERPYNMEKNMNYFDVSDTELINLTVNNKFNDLI